MLDATTTRFLEGGCALIVGTVAPDGAPHASRAWGLTIEGDDPLAGRLLLPVDDPSCIASLGDGAPIAITAADVPTLRSLQLKGRVVGMEPATTDDVLRADRYAQEFFGDIVATDHLPPDPLQRWLPTGYVACTVTVDELYDQTPGPVAGTRWSGGPS